MAESFNIDGDIAIMTNEELVKRVLVSNQLVEMHPDNKDVIDEIKVKLLTELLKRHHFKNGTFTLHAEVKDGKVESYHFSTD